MSQSNRQRNRAAAAEVQTAVQTEEGASKLRILVVDNDEVFREFVRQSYSTPEMPVTVATNGLEALQRLDEREFDVLIADFVMPSIDGATLTRLVRSRESERKLFIILVSAAAREDLTHLRATGADVCIAKAPLQQMRPHLDTALRSAENGSSTDGIVLGLDDVYERQITKELLWQNHQLQAAFGTMQDGVLVTNEELFVVSHNKAAEELLGKNEQEILGVQLDALLPTAGDGSLAQSGDEQAEHTQAQEITIGERIMTATRTRVADSDRLAVVVVLHDVTEQRNAYRRLQRTADHRELLFREIHHRIKNNLHTVASFVRLQSAGGASEEQREALGAIAAQVESIAMVHERLYQGTSFGEVDFGDFLSEMVQELVQFMRPDGSVTTNTEVVPVRFDLTVSTPLALAVSELMTNALQHAFGPDGGTLWVRLEKSGESTYRLSVEDNGSGLSQELRRAPETSHGLQIVTALAEQIGGHLSMEPRDASTTSQGASGTRALIEFQHHPTS